MRVPAGLLVLAILLSGCFGGGAGGDNSTALKSGTLGGNATTLPTTAAEAPSGLTFSYTPHSPGPGDAITFTSHFALPGRIPKAYRWTFGDGSNSTLAAPVHTYTALTAGRGNCKGKGYGVALAIRDNQNDTASFTQCVPVVARPPAVSYTFAPATPAPGDTVLFFAAVTAQEGKIAGFAWDFGDGAVSSDRNATHVFATESPTVSALCKSGGYFVNFTATDSYGAAGSVTKCVPVKIRPPVVSFTVYPSIPKSGQSAQFNGTASDPDGTVKSYLWDFGDGATLAGTTAAIASPAHTFKAPSPASTTDCKGGGYSVSFTATDDDGGKTRLTKCIVVT